MTANRRKGNHQNSGTASETVPPQLSLDERWNLLAEEFPGDPRLGDTDVYAVPLRLLDHIVTHAPNLLSTEDVRFERRLRELAGTGFRDHRPFGCELLDSPKSGEVSPSLFGDAGDQLFRSARRLQQVASAPEDKSGEFEKRRSELQSRSTERLQGFAGWLVTNPTFRSEASILARQWTQSPDLVSVPPALELIEQLYRPGLKARQLDRTSVLVGEARQFLQRWNLARMQTWDLPVPVAPVQFTDDPLPKNELKSMGASLFIPWSLLADRDMKLAELVDYHRNRQGLSHLEGWFSSGRSESWGVERHAKMFVLFVYVECAIKKRYANRLYGNVSKLDMAFRAYFGPPVADIDALIAATETCRKIREELQRRLKRIPVNFEQ